MSVQEIFNLTRKHWWLLALSALLSGGLAWYFTRNSGKNYRSSTLIDTGIVSGFSVSTGGAKLDWNVANNQFENILQIARSRDVLEELNARLLAHCLLLKQPIPREISTKTFEKLKNEFPDDFRAGLLDRDSIPKIAQKISVLREELEENPVKKLLEGKEPIFGLEYLRENLEVKREGSSDFMRINFQCPDAALCRKTLEIFIEIFSERHRNSVEGKTASAVEFFERVTREAAEALRGKEDEMLGFVTKNKIINYYEQTRFIAGKREDFNEFYFKELMTLGAADSGRALVEKRLAVRVDLPKINQTLLMQRGKLAEMSGLLAEIEVAPDSSASSRETEKKNLQDRISKAKSELRKTALANFAVERTPEGAETRTLLDEWIEHWVAGEESRARLGVMIRRKGEFEQIFGQMAPMGSLIRRLEREIGLSERTFLENLHSYNQALLHERSLSIASELKITARPFTPGISEPSKRWMTVVAAALAGLLLAFTVLFFSNLGKNQLHDAGLAERFVGLVAATVFPLVPGKMGAKKAAKIQSNLAQATGELVFRLKNEARQNPKNNAPAKLAVFSQQPGEGKTFIGEKVVSKLRAERKKVLWLRPETLDGQELAHADDHFYSPENFEFESLFAENGQGEKPRNWHYVICEMPALSTGVFMDEVLAQSHAALLVGHAEAFWGENEARRLQLLRSSFPGNIVFVLNGAAA